MKKTTAYVYYFANGIQVTVFNKPLTTRDLNKRIRENGAIVGTESYTF